MLQPIRKRPYRTKRPCSKRHADGLPIGSIIFGLHDLDTNVAVKLSKHALDTCVVCGCLIRLSQCVGSHDPCDTPARVFATNRSNGVWPSRARCGRWSGSQRKSMPDLTARWRSTILRPDQLLFCFRFRSFRAAFQPVLKPATKFDAAFPVRSITSCAVLTVLPPAVFAS